MGETGESREASKTRITNKPARGTAYDERTQDDEQKMDSGEENGRRHGQDEVIAALTGGCNTLPLRPFASGNGE